MGHHYRLRALTVAVVAGLVTAEDRTFFRAVPAVAVVGTAAATAAAFLLPVLLLFTILLIARARVLLRLLFRLARILLFRLCRLAAAYAATFLFSITITFSVIPVAFPITGNRTAAFLLSVIPFLTFSVAFTRIWAAAVTLAVTFAGILPVRRIGTAAFRFFLFVFLAALWWTR